MILPSMILLTRASGRRNWQNHEGQNHRNFEHSNMRSIVLVFNFAILSVCFVAAGLRADGNPPAAGKRTQDLDREVLKKLFVPTDDDGSPDDQNPITAIAHEMTDVVGKLGDLVTGKPTQDKQQKIVQKLDELIAELDKECEACRNAGRSGRNPTRPLGDSVIVGGPGGIGNLHAPKPDGKKWAELPPKERDRILQSQGEGFPAHYQRILERYYRRVAEEQPLADAAEKSGKKP